MKRFNSISAKLIISVGSMIIIAITINMAISIYAGSSIIKKMTDEQLTSATNSLAQLLQSSIDLSIKNYLRGIAEKNTDILKYYHIKQLNGELTKEQTIEKVSEVLLSQKIGKTGYNYIVDSDGYLRVHPKAVLVNTDMNASDVVKKQRVQLNGYLEYMFKNPGELVERSKALYMVYYEPLKYMVSASSYKSEFFDLLDINELSSKVLSNKIGETGYPFVIDTNANAIIHPKLAGKNFINLKDEKGRLFIQDIIKAKSGHIEYYWNDPLSNQVRKKFAYFKLIPEMGWIVVASSYLDEFEGPLNTLTLYLIVFGILVSVLIVISLYIIANRIGKPIRELANFSQAVSNGDLTQSIRINRNDEIGVLSDSMETMRTTILSIVQDINQLSSNSIAGKLHDRSDANKYTGEYRQLISGLNSTIDAITKPLIITADYIESISKGEIPAQNTTAMNGDFDIIRKNLNQCIEAINLLVADSSKLFNAAIVGDLNYRADDTKHNGDFRSIISGVNATLNRLVGMIDEMPIGIQIVDKDNKQVYKNKKIGQL